MKVVVLQHGIPFEGDSLVEIYSSMEVALSQNSGYDWKAIGDGTYTTPHPHYGFYELSEQEVIS